MKRIAIIIFGVSALYLGILNLGRLLGSEDRAAPHGSVAEPPEYISIRGNGAT